MKPLDGFGAPALVALGAGFLTLMFGCWCVCYRFEPVIRAVHARDLSFREKALADRELLNERPAYDAVRKNLEQRLDQVDTGGSESEVVQRAIHGFIGASRANGVTLTSIVPGDVLQPAPPSMTGRRVQVTAFGRFSRLVKFLSKLTKQGVLMGIDSITLRVASESKNRVSPDLDADIGVSIYRIVNLPRPVR